MVLIGVDLGGTKIAGGVVKNGKVVRFAQRPTEATKGKAQVAANLRALIDELAQGKKVTGVGIGVPGTFTGTRIRRLPNIPGFDGVDLKKALKLRCPVALENDARCFALAEARLGAGKGKRDVVALTLGTGLGVCFFLNGAIVRGTTGAASEGGHMYPDPDAMPQAPDWESYLAGPGVLKRYRAHGGTAPLASDAWVDTSTAAMRTRAQAARSLAAFAAGLCRAVDPALVVVGGSMALPGLLADANKLLPTYGCAQKLVRAKLYDSAILGAALSVE